MSELGPVSQVILDYVNETSGYIILYRMIREVDLDAGVSHTENWYFRRLVALALEGRIEAIPIREGDRVGVRFRRHDLETEGNDSAVNRFHRKYGEKHADEAEG